VYICPGLGVPYAKQMVSHSPRNLQCDHLLISRIVQNRLSGVQCRSLRGSADRWIKRGIQILKAVANRKLCQDLHLMENLALFEKDRKDTFIPVKKYLDNDFRIP